MTSPTRLRSRTQILFTAALPVLTLLLLGIVGELLLRAAGYGRAVQYRYVPALGWVHRPSQHALTVGGETVRIDSSGFRGPEVTRQKPAGVFRVLLLGDSYTFGYGVAEAATYGDRLAAMLPGGGPGCVRTEVINTGVNGYDTAQETEFLRQIGVSYQPDLVLIGFTPNDLMDQQETRAVRWPRIKSIAARSAIYQFLAPRMKAVMFRADSRAYRHTMAGVAGAADSSARRRWTSVRAALSRAQSIGRAKGFTVVTALFPTPLEVASTSVGWLRPAFAEFHLASGMPVIDLLPAFRSASASNDVIFLDEPTHHPNARGHAITARVIAEQLLDEGLVPACLAHTSPHQ